MGYLLHRESVSEHVWVKKITCRQASCINRYFRGIWVPQPLLNSPVGGLRWRIRNRCIVGSEQRVLDLDATNVRTDHRARQPRISFVCIVGSHPDNPDRRALRCLVVCRRILSGRYLANRQHLCRMGARVFSFRRHCCLRTAGCRCSRAPTPSPNYCAPSNCVKPQLESF